MPKIRIPLANQIEARTSSLSKDARTVNGYFEQRGEHTEVVKRPGLLAFPLSGDSIVSGAAQGMTSFNGRLIFVVANILYAMTTYGVVKKLGALGTASTTGDVNGTVVDGIALNDGTTTITSFSPTDKYWFTSTLNNTYLFFHNSTNAFYITSSSDAIISVSTNLSSMAPGVAYQDGYICVVGTNARMYNSNADDASTWNALNFITASSDPDGAKGIVRQLNYVVVFGEYSTEFFYDAANPSGSPFSVNQAAKLEIGCADGNSIAKIDQSVIWVGKSKLHGRSVYLLDGGTAPVTISSKYIEKFLNAYTTTAINAYTFKIEGHTFYVMTLVDAGLTFVYDLNSKSWYQWTSYVGGIEAPFKGAFYTEFNESYFALDKDNGTLYLIDTAYTNDNGSNIYFRCVTPIHDGGGTNRKFFPHAEVVGDKVSATAYLSHTGNDYSSFSSARSVDLSKTRAQLWNLGSDRRRAWQLLVTDNVALRLQALEIDYDIGGLEEQRA